MIENEKVIVTKDELINILYQKNNENKYPNQKEITKDEISTIIDHIIALEEQDNKIYNYKDLVFQGKLYKDYNGIDLSNSFQNVYFFQTDEDKYVYVSPNVDLGSPEYEKNVINQIDHIINNNLYPKKLEDYLLLLKKDYLKIVDVQRNNDKPADEKFKEYDYIKIICDNLHYSDIGKKDIEKCIYYLGYNEKVKKFLTLNEEVSLTLILLFGFKNIYLNTSNYYKESRKEYINSIIVNIEKYIQFVKDNKKKIVNETIYSFNHDNYFNLYEFLNNSVSSGLMYKMIEENTIGCLSSTLKLILFEYYISNSEYEKAKIIYENSIKYIPPFPLLDNKYPHDALFAYFLIDLDIYNIEDIKNASYDFFEKNQLEPHIKRNIKILLQFYICAYYYYKHFKEDEKANGLYEVLLHFRNGFGIEDFIIKINYYKMADKLLGMKTDNIDDIDKVIEEMYQKIEELVKVDQFDVENVSLDYENINFDNLDKRVKRYIATGDKIVRTFDNQNEDFDYSCAVIEWSKAVELELNKKFISKFSYENKRAIEEYSKENNPNQKNDFRLDTKNATIGFYDAIKKYNLQDYLYDNYFSKMYTFDRNTYNELCQYMRDIQETRNQSAHKDESIKYEKAEICKGKILKSNMILEIMSKLEEKH